MQRKRNLVEEVDPTRVVVAEYFGLEVAQVSPQPQPDTYMIYIGENPEAQEKYKLIARYGNTSIPGQYDFTNSLLVMWNGKKIQPV
jgi:hypothetical protein